MSLQAIKDVDGFKKDSNNGAVLSIDNTALMAYKKKREKQSELINDINNIKQELKEMKDMLNMFISAYKGS